MAPYGPFITWALRALENVRGPIPTGLCSENEPKASSDRVHPAPAGRGSTLSTAVTVGSLFAFPLNTEKNCIMYQKHEKIYLYVVESISGVV